MMIRPSKRLLISSPSSAEIVGHNEDLISQILLHLPVKSVLRFLSVSKQWQSLLTHPHFVRHYSLQTRNTRRSVLLFYNGNTYNISGNDQNLDTDDFRYLPEPIGHYLRLERSCNGLLLFQSVYLQEEGVPDIRYFVCNPFTRKYRQIAVPDYITRVNKDSTSYLAFDPCTSPYYKVLLFCLGDKLHTYQIFIYSSETETWRNIDQTLTVPGAYLDSSGKFFNGAIFWFQRSTSLFPTTSIYFHIDQESTSIILPKQPSRPSGCNSNKYFGGCGGNLYFVLGASTDSVIDVFVLNKDFSRWVDMYEIDFDVIAYEFPHIIDTSYDNKKYYWCSLVCILEKEEEASMVIGIRFQDELIAYNFTDKTAKKLCDFKTDRLNSQFVETLDYYSGLQCNETLFGV